MPGENDDTGANRRPASADEVLADLAADGGTLRVDFPPRRPGTVDVEVRRRSRIATRASFDLPTTWTALIEGVLEVARDTSQPPPQPSLADERQSAADELARLRDLLAAPEWGVQSTPSAWAPEVADEPLAPWEQELLSEVGTPRSSGGELTPPTRQPVRANNPWVIAWGPEWSPSAPSAGALREHAESLLGMYVHTAASLSGVGRAAVDATEATAGALNALNPTQQSEGAQE